MTWPVAVHIDDTISTLTPADLTRDSPLRFFEVQRLVDVQGRPGTRVLYATPDRVTHYAWPRGLDLPPGDAPLGAGIGPNGPADFTRDVLEVGPEGVRIDVDFTDALGRRVSYRLRQRRPWRGFDFLAPPAAGIEEPTSLFFPYLREFGFVPQPLEFEASFEGRPLTLQKLPFPWAWRRALAQKVARGTVVVELLRDDARPLGPGDPGVEVDAAGSLVAHRTSSGVLPVELAFDPPVPTAGAVAASHTSAWRITVGDDMVMGGTLNLVRDGERIAVGWTVTRGWGGVRQRGAAWLLTRVIRVLGQWPRRYSWSGHLEPGAEPRLVGRWTNARPKR